MGLFKDWKGSRYIIQLCIIKLVCCLGWLSAIVSGQMELSETVSGSASFPDLGITCLGNLAVFFSSFLRGRLHLEIGAKDVLPILTGPTKLKNIEIYGWDDINCFKLSTSREGSALTDCSVVMLSREMPNSSMRQFLEYIANVHDVRSILLQYFPRQSLPRTAQFWNCPQNYAQRPQMQMHDVHKCRCIVFYGAEAFIKMLVGQMHGLIMQLSGSMYILNCAQCVTGRRCHLSYRTKYLIAGSGDLIETDTPAVCQALEDVFCESFHCICIPLLPKLQDTWTNLLIRSFKSKDNEARGAMSTESTSLQSSVSDALENCIAGSGEANAGEEYSGASVIVPRLAEIAINLALTFWFKLDGFSSALVASIAPSEGRVYAIMMGIGIAMGMDFVDLKLYSSILRISPSWYDYRQHRKHIILMCGVITLEIVCFVSGITMVQVLGVKCCARWVYSVLHVVVCVLHVVVWIKWALGSYLVALTVPKCGNDDVIRLRLKRFGRYTYSSAFFLNVILAAVRTKWEYNK